MTREALSKAMELDEQIEHIEKVIEFLNTHNYEQKPPTRDSGIRLTKGFCSDKINLDLNEGEVVYLIDVLESRKICLEREIEKL